MTSRFGPRTTRALRQRLTVFANLRLVEQISPTQAAARMKVRSDLTRGRYERWLASFCAEVGLPYEPWRDAFTRHYGRHYNAIGME